MIKVIDHKLSNLKCILSAIDFLGYDAEVVDNPKDLKNASKIILPGVGAFKDAMKNLKAFHLIDVLNENVLVKKLPILGICLGAQLILSQSEEFGLTKGLNWIQGNVCKIKTNDTKIRIPHTGWNDNIFLKNNILLDSLNTKNNLFYFNHSFGIFDVSPEFILAECDYGQKFSTIINKDNIFATQFHPEKSQKNGLDLLLNFLKL